MEGSTTDSERWFSPEQGDLVARVNGLRRAAEAGRGVLPDDVVDDTARVVDHAEQRLRLSAEHTIVALAGATGSGKSSLFNLLTGIDFAGVGVKRPTTSWALACAWGPQGAEEILAWMGIPPRNQVSRMSMLDPTAEDAAFEGLVLLDLPDHDSTEVSHHLEVDRLVTHADLLVWVLDPQKYADAAVHDRYLKRLTSHADVTMVVLNQLDRVPEEQREPALQDVRRLLVDDGLPDVPVLGTSTVDGHGVADLRRMLAKRVSDKHAAKERLTADVERAATAMLAVHGAARAPGLDERVREELDDALASAAGVPAVADAAAASTRARVARTTAWPPVRWVGALRRDPVDRFGLDPSLRAGSGAAGQEATPAQRSAVEVAVRDVAEQSAAGLPGVWTDVVRRAATGRAEELADEVDRATAGAGAERARPSGAWQLVAVLQWVLLLAALGGLGWLVWIALGSPGAPDASTPHVLGVPVPTVLLVGGLVLGVLIGLLGRGLAARAGRRAGERVDADLREAVSGTVHDRVVVPVREVLERHESGRTGLLAAAGLGGSRRAAGTPSDAGAPPGTA